ncbi:MAG: hypothetical protein KBT69_07280 [Oceanihabitans sp.]|nr:hypothetical protein [Oceanihabitans sp.]
MKKILLLFICVTTYSYSQDRIILIEDNEEIKSKVLEITDTTIKYKKWGNLEGPLYNIKISLVSKINYSNGSEDEFKKESKQSATKAQIHIESQPKTIGGYPNLPLEDVPYNLNKKDNTLITLESAISSTEREKAGIWGHKNFRRIAGNSSHIRLSKREKLVFLVKLNDPKDNPYSIVELREFEVTAERKNLLFTEGAKGKKNEKVISFDIEKLNDSGLYKISIPSKLSKGEYFFNIIDQDEVFAFGVE